MRGYNASLKAIDEYFAEDWESVRAFGLKIKGRKALRSFMKQWLEGFPDVYVHVADVFCAGDEEAGYKTTMPYVLTATNTGPSMYGPATGRKVKYHGIANCFIKKIHGRWMYTNEWDVGDMWSFFVQMGLNMESLSHPTQDLMTLNDCKPLFEFGSGRMNWLPEPLAAVAPPPVEQQINAEVSAEQMLPPTAAQVAEEEFIDEEDLGR